MGDNAANTNVVDSTGVNTGTNQANTNSKTVTGQVDGALTYNGSTDYSALATNASLNITGPITMSTWIKTNSASLAVIFGGYGANPFPGYGLGINIVTTGKIGYWTPTTGSWVETTSNTYNDNNWHYVTVVVNGSSLTFYKDGIPDGSPTGNNPTSYSGVRAIGSVSDATLKFTGNLDEFRVSSINRSADWISTEFNNQNTPQYFYTLSGSSIQTRSAGIPLLKSRGGVKFH